MTHGKIEDPYKALENPRFLDVSKPIVLRLDGKNFSKLSKQMGRGSNSELFSKAMLYAAKELCKEIQGARLAYVASDEMSVVIYRQTENSQVWFNGRINKIESVAASIVSVAFNRYLSSRGRADLVGKESILDAIWAFDARAFNVHVGLLPDYLTTRMTKTYANAWHMFARDRYSHNECKDKTTKELINMLIDLNRAPNIEESENLKRSFHGTMILPAYALKTVAYLGEDIQIYRRSWVDFVLNHVDYTQSEAKELVSDYVINTPAAPELPSNDMVDA